MIATFSTLSDGLAHSTIRHLLSKFSEAISTDLKDGLLTTTGITKTFCDSLDIMSDEVWVLRQTFQVFVSHFTLKMTGEYDFLRRSFSVNKVRKIM